MTTGSKVVYIGTDTLEELLLASHAQCTVAFIQHCPTIYEKVKDAQKEARQALGWAEYDMEIKDA